MAKLNSAGRFNYDAEPKVALRPEANVAIVTAGTVAETAKPLNVLTSYWDAGAMSVQELYVLAHFNLATFTTNETYVLSVEVANDLAFSAGVTIVQTLPNIAGKPGLYVMEIDIPTVKKLAPLAAFIRVKLVTTGTAPNVDYTAWML